MPLHCLNTDFIRFTAVKFMAASNFRILQCILFVTELFFFYLQEKERKEDVMVHNAPWDM